MPRHFSLVCPGGCLSLRLLQYDLMQIESAAQLAGFKAASIAAVPSSRSVSATMHLRHVGMLDCGSEPKLVSSAFSPDAVLLCDSLWARKRDTLVLNVITSIIKIDL